MEKEKEKNEKIKEEEENEVDQILIPLNKKILVQGKEESRIYVFSDLLVEIMQPVLFLASGDYHKIVDYVGKTHYVPYGWKRLIITPMGVKEEDEEDASTPEKEKAEIDKK
jgi:hypothetical protein